MNYMSCVTPKIFCLSLFLWINCACGIMLRESTGGQGSVIFHAILMKIFFTMEDHSFFPDQPTMVFDVKTGTLMSVWSDQYPQFSYLIDAGGELLGVKPFNTDVCTRNYDIEVYRLESTTDKDSRWIKLNDGIGDRVVIFDSRHGFCFNARDFDGFTGNCIYFNGHYCTEDDHCKNGIIRYDMKSLESQLLYCLERNLAGTWFVPSLS